jgi:dTDP-4-amino-4,6-dideoxygalactose transaminase
MAVEVFNMKVKKDIGDLAIFGSKAVFDEPLHVGRPNLPDRAIFLERINEIFDRRWLTNKGPFVQELEKRLADYLAVKHCIAVCNGTVALEILIKALELKGEIICPSFTFVATAHALQWLGLRPVFCDIDSQTHNMDPRQAEQLITSKTSGILGVHLWGRPCAIDDLTRLAQKHHLKLFFDATHAFGSSAGGRKIGNFGEAEVFSLHATKVLHTFEGGAITTDNDELAMRIRLLKNFGFTGFDKVWMLGTNGKMSEIHAAMGLAMMDSLSDIMEANKQRYGIYQKIFEGIDGLQLVAYDEGEQNNFQYVVVEIDEGVTGLSRDRLADILWAENILARRYFYPGCHRLAPYVSDTTIDRSQLKETEKMCERTLCLPTGTAVAKETVDTIAQLLVFIVKNGEAIRSKLPSSKDN